MDKAVSDIFSFVFWNLWEYKNVVKDFLSRFKVTVDFVVKFFITSCAIELFIQMYVKELSNYAQMNRHGINYFQNLTAAC